jgi:hypothetical protein
MTGRLSTLIVRTGALAAVTAALFAVGCGGGDSKEESEQSASPQEALTELRAVRDGLDQALATYRAGDKAKADSQVGDTYLEHFERVEGPLEEADSALKEELEDSIRQDLRREIKASASADKVEALKREIDAGLDQAEAALR